MDKYTMEEVKMLIEENLLSPEVLENILKSSTKRIENYDDNEALKILNYLSNHESVPNETKDEINKYLAQYNSYHVETVEKSKNNDKRKNTIILLFIFIFILIVLMLLLNVR